MTLLRSLLRSRARHGCLPVLLLFGLAARAGADPEPVSPAQTYRPSAVPDRIILTWDGDPATSQAVTWRTDTSVLQGIAQVAPATATPSYRDLPGFAAAARTWDAWAEDLEGDLGTARYHSVRFLGLQPETLYAYRVGDGVNWSEWFHFRTASAGPAPFTFVYFGDAQNDVKSLWSRTIRQAYTHARETDFLLHAGDLINKANADAEWGEWFYAGGWINGMLPSVPAAGNHEYSKGASGGKEISQHWRPMFCLPEHGPAGLEESVYYLDYQGARIVVLNSNEQIEVQTAWLDSVLGHNPQRWTIVTFHHPVFSAAAGRDNPELRAAWMPVLDRHHVDLVLQGHDHTYGRSKNVYEGVSVLNDQTGTVYVVSVSGPKMYESSQHPLMQRIAEDTQLYQIIDVDLGELRYAAYTVTGELYDRFTLVKSSTGRNELVEHMPPGSPERRRVPR